MIFRSLHTDMPLPERMNNPFNYTPHPLCLLAAEILQAELQQRMDWQAEINKGKMFGVLIVRRNEQIGFLAAYSGQIGGRSDWEDFVPAVFDYLQPDGFFKQHEAEITAINHSIAQLEDDPRMMEAQKQITLLQETRQQTIAAYQNKIKVAKGKRDERRKQGNISPEEEHAMIRESQFMKAELHRLKKALAEKTSLEQEYDDYQANLLRLRQLRKQLSDNLQQWLFSHFEMLNPQGERKNLLDIFKDTTTQIPPAGSGECCEPKLLQYAYLHGYQPLQIAMFWWGDSPKEEIRHHLHFYPACHGKCKPILAWMLPDAESNIVSPSSTQIETLYEDDQIAVICKPAGLLAVPGKTDAPSVYSLMRKHYPNTTSPLIVHRLDMATSGLMIIAKTEFAYHHLQQQFANHTIKKRYVAIVCCALNQELSPKGTISLPLLPDYLDRPRQIIDHEHGKDAVTHYETINILHPDADFPTSRRSNSYVGMQKKHARLNLYPETGRTHQLRVHCAHQEGLNCPILGDTLYGNEQADRLYLHAEEITFTHPLTRERLTFTRKADF